MRIRMKDTAFIVVYLFFMTVVSVPLLHNELGRYAKFILPFGILIIIYKVFVAQYVSQAKYGWILLIFISLQFISAIFNYQNELSENISNIFYLSIPVFIIYPDFANDPENIMWKKFKIISLFFIILTFILGIIALGMFATGYIKEENGIRTGFHLGRLYGIYRSPNGGGIYAFTSLLLSAILILKFYRRNAFFKLLLSGNMLIEFCYISLTDSNGTFVSIFAFTFIFLFTYFHIGKKENFILAVIKGIFGILAVILLLKIIQFVLSYIPSMWNMFSAPVQEVSASLATHTSNNPSNLSEGLYRIETTRQYNYELGTGRQDIWKSGIAIICNHPLWGVGKADLFTLAQDMQLTKINPSISAGLHNVFLQIAVVSGIPSMLIFVLFIIKSAKYTLLKISHQMACSNANTYMLSLIGAYLASMVINNLFEATITAMQSGLLIFFWMLIGIVNRRETNI